MGSKIGSSATANQKQKRLMLTEFLSAVYNLMI